MTNLLIGLNLILSIIMFLLIINKLSSRNLAEKIAFLQEKVMLLENNQHLMEKSLEKLNQTLQDQITVFRSENNDNSRKLREEMNHYLKSYQDTLVNRMVDISSLQKNQLETFIAHLSSFTASAEQRMDAMIRTIEERLKDLQQENSHKLDEMRSIVDEKLHSTLERRLGESFKLVSDQLEMVHVGLGKMQSLAVGVGDLKKVLSNIKNRGIWGEIQLGNILSEILTPQQYACNVATRRGSNDRVEFAVKLPGKGDESESVWLPIDAKFPQEDYLRLVDALDRGETKEAEEAAKQLENRIKAEARDIRTKYLDPPLTTDFAIMFLPTESLYAEVVRRPGLIEFIQREYRVNIAGPTTMAALLNSLAVGFRTLAIEKHSSQVWKLLGSIKTEFSRFGDLLDKTRKKLEEASTTIDNAAKKTRTIERKLNGVQEVPDSESSALLE